LTRPPARASPVLIVEDHVDLCVVLRVALEEEGYEVVPALSPKVALEELGRMGRPCLILLDELLADTDERLLRHIRQEPRLHSVPILLLSAEHGVALEERRFISSQVQGILRKPFTLEKLLETVERSCR
jgi:CheY-like chemotaxis protein